MFNLDSDNDGVDERSFFSLSMFDQTSEDSQTDSNYDDTVYDGVALPSSNENPPSSGDRMGGYAPDPSSYQSQDDFSGPSSDMAMTGNDMSNACFTCDATGSDAASLVAECQASGKLVECEEDSMCLMEVRKRNGNYVGMRTLCKCTL